MAREVTLTSFAVQPDENGDGTLAGLRIQKQKRVTRRSEKGATLDYGHLEDDGPELVVPVSHLADLARELIDWPLYYARGEAARDSRRPVSWPNSLQTWTEEN